MNIKKILSLLLVLGFVSGPIFAKDKDDHDDEVVTGPQGPQGKQGPKGDKGDQGKAGAPGINGQNGQDGRDGQDLTEQTKVDGRLNVRLYDGKYVEAGLYDAYDFRGRHNDEVGIYTTIKIGRSYADRQIESLRKEVEELRALTILVRKNSKGEN